LHGVAVNDRIDGFFEPDEPEYLFAVETRRRDRDQEPGIAQLAKKDH